MIPNNHGNVFIIEINAVLSPAIRELQFRSINISIRKLLMLFRKT
jgi:hypothetical protein